MSEKIKWRQMINVSIEEYEAWISEMQYEPYLYDPVLQSIDWIKSLAAAIQKVSPLVGEGVELEYLYWEQLKSWEFILSCISIARAFGGIIITDKGLSWKNSLLKLKYWFDASANEPQIRNLYMNGAAFIYDLQQFYNDNRKLSDPKKLAKAVLKYKL